MKTAAAKVAAIYIFCPHCDEPYYGGDNYSSLIIDSINLKPGQVLTCSACGEKYKAPAMLRKLP